MTIAVYGASGYQGKLVLAELARRGLDVVLAGRHPDRLRAAATATGLAGADLRVADSADHDALVAAFQGCAVVVNCAGPFTAAGLGVARAAIAAGSHHLDTAGEQPHVLAEFEQLGAAAEAGGVAVVPSVTDSTVPTDLVAHLIAERAPDLDSITLTHRIDGGGAGISRGSLRSLAGVLDVVRAGGVTYRDGGWREGVPAGRTEVVFPDRADPVPVARIPLSDVVTVPRHVSARLVEGLVDRAVADLLGALPAPEVLAALPEGPAEADRRAQTFTYLVDAVTTTGARIRGVVRGRDTYRTTAVVAVEAARRLAEDGAKPGVLAPAQAFDPADLLAALAPADLTWAIEDADR